MYTYICGSLVNEIDIDEMVRPPKKEIDILISKSLIIIYVFDQRYVALEDINIVFLHK